MLLSGISAPLFAGFGMFAEASGVLVLAEGGRGNVFATASSGLTYTPEPGISLGIAGELPVTRRRRNRVGVTPSVQDESMARHPRIESSTGIYHVMNRGVDRSPIFFDDGGRVDFGRCLAECNERYDFTVLAYCLMSNHYHLVVRAPSEELSRSMHRLGTRVARHTNDNAGRDGPLFRGRFRALPVETDEYFENVVRYVHRNPLDLPTAEPLAEYRWSSYRTYLGLRRPPRFLDTSLFLDRFDGDTTRIAEFTEGEARVNPRELDPELVLAMLQREIASTSASLGIDTTSLRESAVIDAVAHHLGAEVADTVAPLLPHRSRAAARTARLRAKRRLQSDAAIQRVVERFSREIGCWPNAA